MCKAGGPPPLEWPKQMNNYKVVLTMRIESNGQLDLKAMKSKDPERDLSRNVRIISERCQQKWGL